MGQNPHDTDGFAMVETIPSIFEHIVQKYPDHIAIVYRDQAISYRELDKKVNQLAQFIKLQDVDKESVIAVSMERSPEMIISILGVLKAGCAYVPLDPKSPAERNAFILEDTQTPLLLTQATFKKDFSDFHNIAVIALDLEDDLGEKLDAYVLEKEIKPEDLAYCIYTSGSTGKPKGVLVEHRNVVNLIKGEQQFFNRAVDKFLFAYSFIFDGSVLLIFKTLLEGATLVIAEDGLEKDIQKIAELIQKESISHLLTFPSLYSILLDNVDGAILKTLKSVSVAGEACPGALVRLHHQQVPKADFFNQYGPTEATVGTTIYKTSNAHQGCKTPIGICIPNTFIHLLDENLQAVEKGMAGEICIGGRGVTRGYLNRPDLTKAKFIENPFGEGRLYRTGDLAKELPDGNFDFIGRVDFQVKLRGYRIELGEIEAVLLQHEKIRETVVVLHGEEAADQRLIAYVVSVKSQVLSFAEMRAFVEKQLPEYMVPATFVFLEKMPLSTSGKVDRKQLPDPPNDRPNLEEDYIAPTTDLEKYLAAEWSKVLNISQVGVRDKFFELGGNSLQAAKFIADFQRTLKENIFITSIFEYPTIHSFIEMLQRDYKEALKNITTLEEPTALFTEGKTIALTKPDFQNFHQLIPPHQISSEQTKINPQAIFILAPPRSGTTLLRVMLAGHPDLFAANELQLLHFENLKERASAYKGKFSLWKEGTIRALMELKGLDADAAKTLIQEAEKEAKTTSDFYAYLQGLIGPQILVDKSPSYILDRNALHRAEAIFENALYIHLSRHPYSMVKSFEKMRMNQVMYLEKHDYTARQLGELIWQQSHHNALEFLQDIPTNRQFHLSYEAMIADPEAMMRQLCERFDLDFHPNLIKPYEGLEQKMTDGIYKDSKPMGDIKLLQHGKINAALANNWKGVLTDNFLHKNTWDTAQTLGYPLPDTEKATTPKKSNNTNKGIAIIGMALRLPGAENLQTFWKNLVEARDVSQTFSKEDLLAAGLEPELIADPDFVNRGVYLKDADCFDAEFFGYLPKEAALMDPQHRIFLECAYAALEDAGYDPDRTDLKIGVLGGVARNTYLINNVLTHPNYFKSIDDFQLGITLEKDFPATRVAYKLNLKGPAINVQTACSTSGVAVHLACQSIRSGDSDLVIVGGGRIQPPVGAGHLHKEGHALSPDGYCRTFDADANGMVRGHGMAFLVLKNLNKALEDGDQIHAVIKGTAINNDGAAKIGFTAPSVQGQSQAIIQAYENAGVDPASLTYIEAHGTGTAIGDPIEIAGLTKAFSKFTNKKQFCHIGSVKANIGHLDAGASIAGIIKTVLAMQQEQLPPLMHFKAPNPQIDWTNTPFVINTEAQSWEKGETPRRAGVSSFGLGGTNAHIVLEEAPKVEKVSSTKSHELILLSAKNASALDRVKQQYADYFSATNETLDAIVYTLQTGRKAFSERAFLIAENISHAAEQLHDPEQLNVFHGKQNGADHKIAFMFPGGGAQHSYMGFDLFQQEPVFKNAVLTCLDILKEDHQLDFYNILYPSTQRQKSEALKDPLQGITLLFTIEYATAKLWESWGIQPSELIGHSLGEYTAACISGVFSLRDALALVAKRGKLFLTLEQGAMLSVALPAAEAEQFLNEELSIAAINRPDNCVFSGKIAAIEAVEHQLAVKEIKYSRLHISVAAHSVMIDPILQEFEQFLHEIEFSAPKIPIISNVTGRFVGSQEIQSPTYWLKHLRQTVRFSEGVELLLNLENRILLEVGPGQTLCTFARQHPAKINQQTILASLRHPKESINDYAFILKAIGQLWLSGINIQWKALHHDHLLGKVSLPTYPFERTRHWISPKQNNTIESYKMKQADQNKNEGAKLTRKDLIINDLKEIFHQLSGIEKNQMNQQATFLEMGFDSLFLTQAVAKIKKKLPVKINFRQLFEEAPNFNALAIYLEKQLPASSYEKELKKMNEAAPVANDTPLIENAGSVTSATKVNYAIHREQPVYQKPIDTSLQSIIQQQLELMQRQLDLLSGGTAQRQSADIRNTPSEVPKETPVVEEDDEPEIVEIKAPTTKATAHGPWKPISKKNEDGLTEQQEYYLADLIRRYTTRTKGSQALTQAQRKHLADPRSITGFNRLWKDMVYQIAVERSKGSKLWDVDGNEYIDYRNAFGISLFGHTPDFVQEAVQAQLAKGFELGVLTPLAKKVADLLCELSGCERATLVNTGSEAIVAAVRAARTVTMKDKVIVFAGDYHGIADEMLVRAVKMNGRTKAMPVAPGIPNLAVQNMIILDYDDPDVLKKIKAHVHEVAAVLIEPIQPNLPTRQPKVLLQEIRKITAEHEVALIFDEMITGFRVALGGAQEWYGVKADLIAYGKIISGGLPMAAVAGKSEYMDAFDGGQWRFGDDSYPEAGVTFFGGTFVKHPLALAASYAALSEIKRRGPQMYEELNAKTAQFAAQLKELFLKTKAPLQVLSTASVVAIKLTDDNPLCRLVFYYLRLKGIHIKEKAALVSVAHSVEDLEHTVKMFEESIKEMQTAGFFKITVVEAVDRNAVTLSPSHQTLPVSTTPPFVEKECSLTDGQKEIWVEQQLGKSAAAAYNLGAELRFSGSLEVAHLQQAFQQLVQRHEALRTTFSKTETIQSIWDRQTIEIPVKDISTLSKAEQAERLASIRHQEGEVSIDIFSEIPYRTQLVKISDTEHYFYFTIHHIIADGWSMGVLTNDLSKLFTALSTGVKIDLPEPRQLSDFVKEQEAAMAAADHQAAVDYWKSQFSDDFPVLEFPTDRSRPTSKTYGAKLEQLHIDASLYAALKQTAIQEKTTFFNLMYSAFQVFIHRLSHQDDFVLGITAAAQASGDNPNLVMHGVNLLPIRLQTNPADRFAELLQVTRTKVLDAFEHQSLAFGNLVKQLKMPRDPSRTPLISILFNMDSPMGDLAFGHLKTTLHPIQRNYETFDIFINIKPIGASFSIEWIYNTDLFDTTTIQRRLKGFKTLLASIAQDANQSVGRLQILPEAEKKILLEDWNDNLVTRPKSVLHQYLEEQAVTTPDQIAISDAQQSMTYHQLNQRANQVAHYFVAQGVHTGNFIGVYFERGVDMMVALMACMKIGAIYVPLDPINPKDRIKVIIDDAQADFLITKEYLIETLPSDFENVICLDRDEAKIRGCSTSNLFKNINPEQFVYVNYTSGSTGKPKGVLIPHYAVVDHHLSIIKALGLGAEDKIFGVASIAFDPSVQDFFMPLMIGAQVYIASEAEKTDGFKLKDAIDQVQPTLMQATPSTWRMLLTADWKGVEVLTILCGGEGLTKELSNKLIARSKKLYNIYGPTETTIWSTLKLLEGDRSLTVAETSYEPIGRPIDNVQIYLLDKHQYPVPIGVAGEVYIGGVGVAPQGYFKREELNAEKFIGNPFENTFGAKLYRTGDLARYLANGDLEYLNRADSQGKIRGFRIELGEIESAIDQYEGIRENVVIIREDQKDNKRLVAYYIAEQDQEIDLDALKKHLKQKLPEYMVPVAYVGMKEFPLTATMKINRGKLPLPEAEDLGSYKEHIPAESKFEKIVEKIWTKLLGIAPISIEADFFELGGHSLNGLSMIALIEKETGKKLPLATLLENSTIRKIAALLDDDQKIEERINSSLVPIKPEGTKTPLYLVHGAGLHVLMFQTLAANMDEDQALYALQARGLNGEAEPFSKMEDIAAHYIQEILEQNPDGPYALAGYSFGGLIAFEMAKQLRAKGKEVVMLAMFDTIVHQTITDQKSNNNYYKRLATLGKKVAWNISLLAKNPIPNLKYKSHVLKRRYQRWAGQNIGTEMQETDAVFGGKVDQANKQAFDQYQLSPYDGKIHIFKATSQRFYLDDFEYLGWKPYAKGGVEIHTVPGDHLTLFDPPHGQAFARILQECLDKIASSKVLG